MADNHFKITIRPKASTKLGRELETFKPNLTEWRSLPQLKSENKAWWLTTTTMSLHKLLKDPMSPKLGGSDPKSIFALGPGSRKKLSYDHCQP